MEHAIGAVRGREDLAVVDRELITGQNPQSSARVAEMVMQALQAHKTT